MGTNGIACDLCDTRIESVDAAIAAGWHPSYFIGDDDTGRAICPHCASNRCRVENDELILIENPAAGNIAAAIELLARAADELQQSGLPDGLYAAALIKELISIDGGQSGLRRLLELQRAKK